MSASFGLGSTLGTGSRIWLRNLPAFVALAVVCYLPVIAFNLLMQVESLAEPIGQAYFWLLELHPILFELAGGTFLVFAFAVGAIAYRVVGVLEGQRPSIIGCLGRVVRRAPVIVVVAVIIHLVIGGIMGGLKELLSGPWPYRPELHVMIIGELVALVLRVAVVLVLPVVVCERVGPLRAIARGWQLARGARIRLFALLLAVYVIEAVVRMLLQMALLRGDTYDMQHTFLILAYSSLGVTLLVTTYRTTLAAVAYRRLREDRDGPSTDALVEVFE